jgi:hypothetical protein
MPKVVMVLVDSLSEHQLQEALSHRSVPGLQFLSEHVQYRGSMSTVYPAMTATVDSSLLSGTYPDVHKIPGLVWYDSKQRRIINDLNGLACVAATGVVQSAIDNLHALNERHLSTNVETIYEALQARAMTSASINAIVHRGRKRHVLRLPGWLRWLSGWQLAKTMEVSGPEQLVLGDLTSNRWRSDVPGHLRRPWRAYGVNDGYAVAAFKQMLRTVGQTDFTMIYLPDNDHVMHRKNPAHMRDATLQLDRHICGLLDACGDWRRAMADSVWILLSDHGQVQVAKQAVGQIDLDAMLRPFHVLPLRAQTDGRVGERYELAVANNERMAYLYPLKEGVQARLIEVLEREARFDVIATKDGEWVTVLQGGSRRRLRFAKAQKSEDQSRQPVYTDIYQQTWRLDGEWSVLDLHTNGEELQYSDYPDALARLYGALFAHEGSVIAVNARPRYEIHSATYPRHKNGGAHGSLHRSESEVPLWICGAQPNFEGATLSFPTRITDIKSLVMHILCNGR